MRDMEEHKKLLEQSSELEKSSINYFDVEKEFFLINSNNLSQVRPRLYGYSIQATGIYEDDNLTREAIDGLDGRGCYVYVEVKDGKITIKQDLNGSWGIFLFRQGDYFALSNSFFRLLDHVKFKYPLTVNRDYCHYLMIALLASSSPSETAVNEIQLVDRSAILRIDIAKKNLEIELIDYKEHTLSPDSKEGVAVLDSWIEFWSNFLRALSKNTKFLKADLSGGFDTRLSFVPLLHSGIDLNSMLVYSSNDGLHTHGEDYEIASKIAEHYGFNLNKPLPTSESLNYSLSDCFNFNLYTVQTFSSIPRLAGGKRTYKTYSICGGGGELIRRHWHMSPEMFIQRQINYVRRYSRKLSQELSRPLEDIVRRFLKVICGKYKIEDNNSDTISQYLYREGRCRHHFGKDFSSGCLMNTIRLSPDIDPKLSLLNLNSSACPDYDLLMALIFTRYEPDLLTFPFDSNRSIAPETVEYARKINERFPYRPRDVAKATTGGGVQSSAA